MSSVVLYVFCETQSILPNLTVVGFCGFECIKQNLGYLSHLHLLLGHVGFLFSELCLELGQKDNTRVPKQDFSGFCLLLNSRSKSLTK